MIEKFSKKNDAVLMIAFVAAVAPVLVGTALAYADQGFAPLPAAAAGL